MFSMDPIVYSPNEAINDVTFEACTADFFGIGMFYAIGYPVDANGELLLTDSEDIAGSLELEFPPDDWEAKGLDDGKPDARIKSDSLQLDLRIASAEQAEECAAGAEHSWVIPENGFSGSAVFTNVRQEVFQVDIEATCR